MERCRKHSLQDILVIAICGFLCGVDNWAGMELFGNAKLAWFRTFLELPNGIPSHDTFGRVFSLLEPEPFARCFTQWAQTVAEATEGKVVAIDGEAVRRSFDKAGQKACVHLVNAWVAENRCVLGPREGREGVKELEEHELERHVAGSTPLTPSRDTIPRTPSCGLQETSRRWARRESFRRQLSPMK